MVFFCWIFETRICDLLELSNGDVFTESISSETNTPGHTLWETIVSKLK